MYCIYGPFTIQASRQFNNNLDFSWIGKIKNNRRSALCYHSTQYVV